MPYGLIDANLKGLKDGAYEFNSVFFLPNLLTKWMNFKEVDRYIFINKWSIKEEYILKTDIFKIGKKIIRSMNYFNRYFPKMVELTSYEDFV